MTKIGAYFLGLILGLTCATALTIAFAARAHAGPLTYDLAGPELVGNFTQNGAITAWDFTYVYPEATYIVGYTDAGTIITDTRYSPLYDQSWYTEDGGAWNAGSQTLTVTNPDLFTLSYQLCGGICADQSNVYAFSILDQRAGLTYSGWGVFAPQAAAPTSVPEPSTIWLLTLALAIGLGVSYCKDVLRVFTSAR